jgi:hypothetical protein
MSISVIKLTNRALVGNDISFKVITELAYKVGYVVDPRCCTNAVQDYLNTRPMDYNSTFYKTWNKVANSSRFEIWIDQIKSYIANYILNVQYVPNKGSEQPEFTDLKVILPITQKEVNEICCGMLYTGISLSEDTLNMILEVITDVDIEKVKNKEAMMSLHKKFGTVPKDNVEFVRFLVFLATNKTLLIKDKATLAALKVASIDLPKLIEDFGIEKLAEVFFRFKPIFLSLGKIKGNKVVVNRLRRLADKYHKPMKVGFFESILSNPKLIVDLPNRLKECSNYKKVLLLQTIKIRQKELEMQFFLVRNNKIWAKEKKTINKEYYSVIYSIIYQSLVDSMSKKACEIKLPKGVDLALPTSEKSYVGIFPIGTSFDLVGKDTILGIHRLKENAYGWLDFSLNSTNNDKIGWNANFKDEESNIMFSGDICDWNRSKEVAELYYCANGFKENYILKVNDYNKQGNIPFKFFIAQEAIDTNSERFKERNYMVDPNNIKFLIDLVIEGGEQSIGVITPEKLILAKFRTGSKEIAGVSITNRYAKYAEDIKDCYVNLKQVLTDAGFTINSGNDPDIDLTKLSKDTLISLLA